MFDSQTAFQSTLIGQSNSDVDVSLRTRYKTIVVFACTSLYMTIAFEEIFTPHHIHLM